MQLTEHYADTELAWRMPQSELCRMLFTSAKRFWSRFARSSANEIDDGYRPPVENVEAGGKPRAIICTLELNRPQTLNSNA